MAQNAPARYNRIMPVRRPLPQILAAAIPPVMAALLLAGCGLGDVFAQFPPPDPATAGAPWPRLVDGETRLAEAGPAPSPVTGLAILDDLSREAARSSAEAERVSAPVFEVETLRRDADAVRGAAAR